MRNVPPGIQIIASICEEPSRSMALDWNVDEEKSAVISSIAFQPIGRSAIKPAQATQERCHVLLDRGPTSSGLPRWYAWGLRQPVTSPTRATGAFREENRGRWQDRTKY